MKSYLTLTNVQTSDHAGPCWDRRLCPSSSAVAQVGQNSPTMQRAASTWKK